MPELKLIAFDAEDLAVMSAHLQDAGVGDLDSLLGQLDAVVPGAVVLLHGRELVHAAERGLVVGRGQLGANAPDRDGRALLPEALDQVFVERVDRYDTDHNRPDRNATSRLSADLRFGTLAARRVVEEVGDATEARKAFIRQIAWRDWFAHLLHENPKLATEPLQKKYDKIQWLNSPADIARWKGGFTGYPIVDAGMRELRETGFMHNRVRMITAMFLSKDLFLYWRLGEEHFARSLIDFFFASNNGGWQWSASTGTDAD